ncbi:hypothetical protein AB0L97_08085 [Nocardia sp. NPDC051911]|uniref:hypothetical protein n=1 Tax=Nocardia sp. NPDC051911 TaxID=3154648 RepID=UPI0034397BAE
MNERTPEAAGLLDEVLTAHGGLERWRAVTALTAHGRFGGLLRSRFPGNRMAEVSVRVQLAHQRAVFRGFPRTDQQAVFDGGAVRIETRDGGLISARRNARAAFAGFSGLRRNLRWDALDAAYFAGYAFWNYLSTPLLLTREGVAITEGDTWQEAGQRWWRLEVDFPPDLHTHSRHQTFYIDAAGLIRRHDYIAHPIGRWAHAAHYCSDHQRFAGLVFPARRRVFPQGPGGRTLPHPILVALDIDNIEIET